MSQSSLHILHETLETLGLSRKEILVYLSCLSGGYSSAGAIAKRTGLNRAHTYDILMSLIGKRVMSEATKNGVKQFACSPPSFLLTLIQEREESAAEQKERFMNVLAQLECDQQFMTRDEGVRLFDGTGGIRQLFEFVLSVEPERLLGIQRHGSLLQLLSCLDGRWAIEFEARRQAAGIWAFLIVPSASSTHHEASDESAAIQIIRHIDSLRNESEIFTFGEYVAVVTLTGPKNAVLIRNKSVAATMRELHRHLWMGGDVVTQPNISVATHEAN